MDWIAGLPTTAAAFDMIQNHVRVDLLSGKVHAVPTRSTATATDAAVIIRDMCLRSCAGFPDALVLDHDAKLTSEVFRAFVKSMGSCLIVGSAYHKNTNAKVERANGVISDTLRAYANGRKDDWDSHLTLAEFAINSTASTLGDDLTPVFIDRGAHPRLPLSPPRHDLAAGESPAHYTQRKRAMEATLAAAQADMKAKLDTSTRCSRSATGCCCGPRSCCTPPTLVSCDRCGTVRARCPSPTPTPSRCRVACAAARPSTSTASNPSSRGPGRRLQRIK